jgi:hypothetical protein
MSYLKDREIWLSSVPTGNPPVGYFWVFVQNGVLVVRDSNGVDKIMASTAGSITTASTASYVQYSNVANKPTLVSGSSQVSFTGITNKPTLVSGSAQITYSGVSGKPEGIVSSSVQVKGYNVFATTGSNQFNGSQAITGSLTVTGQVVAQTLNVQQVTSSIVYSSGSNIFGNNSGNKHQFTGSLAVTGSLTVAGAGTFAGSVRTGGLIYANGNLGTSTGNQGTNTTSATLFLGNRGYFTDADTGAATIRAISTGTFWYSGTALSFSTNPGPDVTGTAAVERIRITSEGNVGIGTDIPVARLQLNLANAFPGTVLAGSGIGNAGNNFSIITTDAQDQNVGGMITFGGMRNSDATNVGIFGGIRGGKENSTSGNTSGTLGFYTLQSAVAFAERMRITSVGNVGIGTTNPNALLQVGNGTQAGSNSAGNKIHIATTGTRSALLTLANSSGGTTVEGQFESSAESDDLRIIIGSTSNHDVVFRTNNSEKMRIASGGLVTLTGALSGSSATFSSIIKSGGTSTQFLKADGSVDSTTYAPSNFYAIDYLVLAGAGGGGGSERSNGFGGGGAGGGAGGLLVSTTSINVGSSYTIVVGAGGAGGVSRDNGEGGGLPGTNGGYSQIFDTITIGGGQGQGEENSTSAASTGGSGGGRGGDSSTNAGSGTLGQGNGGGNNAGRCGGGGGGANTAGGNAIDGVSGGVGGNGITWFDGNVYACGGGGGGGAASTGTAAGGSSNVNGGLGSRSTGDSSGGAGNGYAQAGAANTGTGGGGAGAGYDQGGQNGGSGIVIIRYPGSQRGTGGTVTSSGGYTYHRFTTSGTFTA